MMGAQYVNQVLRKRRRLVRIAIGDMGNEVDEVSE